MPNAYSDQVKAGIMHGWHVYVLAEQGDAFSKIGSALNVKYRLSDLRNGNPRTLSVVADWHFDDRDAGRAVESRALVLAGPNRLLKRDWLKLPFAASIVLVERAIAELGLLPRSTVK